MGHYFLDTQYVGITENLNFFLYHLFKIIYIHFLVVIKLRKQYAFNMNFYL